LTEVWILGASGRIGSAVARRLATADLTLVLLGRDAAKLQALASTLGQRARVVTTASLQDTARELAQSRAAVVVNTIGPFGDTAGAVIGALPPGAHYVDLCAELAATGALLDRHEAALASGHTLVTGAGFGVLAAESVLLKLCEGRPNPARVRLDLVPAIDSEDGVMGEAFAATVVDVLATGGRRYAGGRLESMPLGSDPQALTLPDGDIVHTGCGPGSELEVAHRITGASSIVVASTAAPSGPIRHLAPLISALVRIPAVRRFATRRLAVVPTKAKTRGRPFSYAHVQIEWASGEIREGWLQAGEGMAFTAEVTAEVARRLARGEGKPGAYSPGALFGPALAEAAGGRLILSASGA
jgi:short subunit dehydrogenase-like uncharacterized protein